MSPGLTTERVYDTLKRRIMYGELAPGERLDPVRLAVDLGASATPVRDALHRLLGERMVQAWPQDGFHVLVHSEVGLRDLYSWNLELLSVILRSVEVGKEACAGEAETMTGGAAQGDHAHETSRLFRAMASSSANFEHRHAIANASDRLHAARRVEPRVIMDVDGEIEEIVAAWDARASSDLRKLIGTYHRRRIRKIHRIAAFLRPAPDAVGL